MRNKNTKSKLLIFFLLMAAWAFLPSAALADPHAMFYTDRAQEQLFYNVLAALNQADYVEAPLPVDSTGQVQLPPITSQAQPTSPPQITTDIQIGNYIATGEYTPQNSDREATFDQSGKVRVTGPDGISYPLEPLERTNLPRIAVRQVTSDNGDAFFRESVQRRALAERIRVEIAHFSCRILVDIYGPKAVTDASQNQPGSTDKNKNPCDEYLKAEKNS